MSTDAGDDGLTFPITDALRARFRRTDATTKVAIERTPDDGGEGERVTVFAPDDPRWFKSGQKRRTLANELLDVLDRQGLATDGVKTEFADICRQLATADDEDDDMSEFMTPPIVARLLEYTESVEFVTNETPVIRVTLAPPGRDPEAIEFSAGEWIANNPKPLIERYYTTFYTKLDVEDGQWVDLSDRWELQKEVVEGEAAGKWAGICEAVLDDLAMPTAVADRESVNDRSTAWFDESAVEIEADGGEGGDASDGVLWVRYTAVRDALESAGHKDEGTQLAKELKDRGELVGNTQRVRLGGGERPTVWPFDPAALKITPLDVEGTENPGEGSDVDEELREEITEPDTDAASSEGEP